MKKLNLKKLREVGEKATEGPWNNINKREIRLNPREEDGGAPFVLHLDCDTNSWWENPEDVEFTTEARNSWEALIEALAEAKEIIEVLPDDPDYKKQLSEWLERFEDEG